MDQRGHSEPVGGAKITQAFALLSKFVIHTVGPQLQRGAEPTRNERSQLQACYTSSRNALLQATLSSGDTDTDVTIAFPCISTGLFAFPSAIAVPLVVEAVTTWLETHEKDTRAWKVIFNTFLQGDFDLYKTHFERLASGIVLAAPSADPNLERALQLVQEADYLLISGGAGLSAAAGLDYTSEDVMNKFHAPIQRAIPKFRTMYSSIGYTTWSRPLMWGYLFKQVSIVRFDWVRHRTASTHDYLRRIRDRVDSKGARASFVTTSNADGMFEQEGFPRDSLYTMQGEYGRIQCKRPCRRDSVFDVRPFMEKALESFNPVTYEIEDPDGISTCPHCLGPMFLLLRVDDSFMDHALESMRFACKSWLANVMAAVRERGKKLVVLEVGVGFNTPGVLCMPNEELATHDGVSLLRVNNEHPEIPFESNGVGLGLDANQVLANLARGLDGKTDVARSS